MKYILAITILAFPFLLFAHDSKKKISKPAKKEPTEIEWITSFSELQSKMTQNPKKVYMDVYTDWCGWCKKMDATTFTNPNVVKYMNKNFYCVKFNAERKDTISFQDTSYFLRADCRCNALAAKFLQGKMSYPTAVIMMENFKNSQPIPGYLNVSQMEPIVTYIGDNVYLHDSWDNYSKTYKPTWDNGVAPDMTPPPAHGLPKTSPPGN